MAGGGGGAVSLFLFNWRIPSRGLFFFLGEKAKVEERGSQPIWASRSKTFDVVVVVYVTNVFRMGIPECF